MNTPNIPRSNPSAPSNGPQQPNQSNVAGAGFEQSPNTFSKSVQRSKVIKKATSGIISSREDFTLYLRKSRLDLLTSAVIFQETGDFIESSYIVYLDHNNTKEPLASFLQRYPNLLEPIQKINDSLKPLQSSLQIRSSQ
jgi:hypothetical protein